MRKQAIRGSRWLSFGKLAVYAGIACVLSTSCSSNYYEGMIVAVEWSDDQSGSLEGSKLIAIDPDRPDKPASLLSEAFESACAPAISYDGRYLFFQGKKEGDELWQIWIMDFRKKSIYRVTDQPEDCTNPASLPDGTLIFSKAGMINDTRINMLFRCNSDGSGLSQLTFNPEQNLYSTVLQEGRILYVSSQQYPESKTPVLMVMRPDGTKSEIYYKGSEGSFPITRAIESEDGYVYFIESGGNLIRLNHYRPLHTAVRLSEGVSGKFSAVIPCEESRCLVSYQAGEGDPYALYEFNTVSRETPTLLYKGERDVSDPVRIAAMKERPRILPSAVNTENPAGLLMSQDINHSMIPVNPTVSGDTLADRIKVYGVDGLLGEVEVEDDGSFYMKLDADRPIRVATLNAQGETVRGPSDWITLRPNERRGCVGCHADPELAPKNVQPMAVKGPPVVLSGMKKDQVVN